MWKLESLWVSPRRDRFYDGRSGFGICCVDVGAEMNANMIVVEHGISEMPGMQNMATYLEQKFPGIDATFYCQEPNAQTITGK